ncbi:hypothetical protein SC663_09570 [Legionella pneumophila serogroup 1]|uniref:Uncharacterized protein n=1 Tax=Fluoribacter dumoffii TaxID=463 RepID=A0A377GCM3_9GAMM|nr:MULTISPECIES: hypothetical protein [Legionellaceae]KTC92787.1 hypothetical protein Ldum_0103 [Fluoribacter dumoffii NY 23]MDW9174441.1 hypothetical protein [Legionella pneumophila]SNV18354.1 Uncharacterised protein [Legionella pneumophila]STO22078.1 Uncharacterised protein [Fluoribacter dumoffii]HAT4425601.1 hypothetical protein [Legionella pneumophila]
MSSSTKEILDLMATDYSLYSRKHHEKQPSQEEEEELCSKFMTLIPEKELAKIIASGHRFLSLEKTRVEIQAHQNKLSKAGIEKSKNKVSPTEVTLTYKIKSTPEFSQFFNAPWVQKSKKPDSELQSITTTENSETIELNCSLKFKS